MRPGHARSPEPPELPPTPPAPPWAASAGRGIGLEFVRQLAQRGCRVVAAVRSPPAAPPLLRELEGVTVTELDVTRPDSVQRWAAAIAELAPHADVSGAAGSALGLGLGSGSGGGTAQPAAASCVRGSSGWVGGWVGQPAAGAFTCLHLPPSARAARDMHRQVLINNAGIYGRRIDLGTVTADDMLAAFTTNAIGERARHGG